MKKKKEPQEEGVEDKVEETFMKEEQKKNPQNGK